MIVSQNINVCHCGVMLHVCVSAPEPEFDQTIYRVPENDRTVPLCIDVGVVLTEPTEFVITSKSKDPPEAQG